MQRKIAVFFLFYTLCVCKILFYRVIFDLFDGVISLNTQRKIPVILFFYYSYSSFLAIFLRFSYCNTEPS